jgi:hypothetical protein
MDSVSTVNIDISGTGQEVIGRLVAADSEVLFVNVASTDQDFEFNVTHNGSDVFASEKSPTVPAESFVPEQNTMSGAGDSVELIVDISSASGATTPEASFDVLVRTKSPIE